MAKKPRFSRKATEFKRGTVAPWPASKPPSDEIARRVRYVADGKHKSHPSVRWTLAYRADVAKCAHFREEEWHRLEELLRNAVRAECVDADFRGDFPACVWAFINGQLHEARLTNHQQGEYHGFPLVYEEQRPVDPHRILEHAPRVEVAVI